MELNMFNKKIFWVCSLLIFIIGLSSGYLLFHQEITPGEKKTESYKNISSSEIKKGRPDTTNAAAIIKTDNSKGDIKITRDSSIINDYINQDKIASWDTTDSRSGFHASLQYNISRDLWSNFFLIPHQTVTRVDTIYKTHTIESVSNSEKVVFEYPKWNLNLGANYINTGFNKYISLQYTNTYLVDISVEAGFYNNINEQLKNVKPFVKTELKIKL